MARKSKKHAHPRRTGHADSENKPHPPAGENIPGLISGPEDEPNPVKRFFKILGPGLVTGASDDDPSGIGTYAIAGAQFGYATLWLALITFPLMAAIQFICAKIGLVYGKGLAGIMRRHYPRSVVYPAIFLLVVANTINAAADLAAVAAGINLLVPVPVMALVLPLGILILVLQIWGSYRVIANTFRWLTLSLFAYIGSAFLAHPNWGEVFRGTFIPTLKFDSEFLAILVALLGTTISPYLFFWQSDQEVEEQIAQGRKTLWQRKGATNRELRYAAWDVNTGMLLSNVVMYFIIFATAATLHKTGHTHVETATDAAEALRPIAGEAAYILMAFGLIGSGILTIPILTGSAAYSIAEIFGWRRGLDQKFRRAKPFYIVIAATTICAMLINYIGISPMDALFWTAVINGFLSPPLMVIVMLISNNPKVMGHRVNGPTVNIIGWLATAAMFAAAIILVWSWIP